MKFDQLREGLNDMGLIAHVVFEIQNIPSSFSYYMSRLRLSSGLQVARLLGENRTHDFQFARQGHYQLGHDVQERSNPFNLIAKYCNVYI